MGHNELQQNPADDESAPTSPHPEDGPRSAAAGDVTRIFSQIEHGDVQAAEQLLPLVYNELRKLATQKMAQEKPGLTLQPTALVHEAYMRLVNQTTPLQWDGRGHFFSAAAEAMRRILVENARRKNRLKRGGDLRRQDLSELKLAAEASPEEILDVDEAIYELSQEHPEKAKLVKLRFFGGLTVPEAAAAMGISTTTADRHWSYARAWLYRKLQQE